jgi:hypothetical protein
MVTAVAAGNVAAVAVAVKIMSEQRTSESFFFILFPPDKLIDKVYHY